MQGEDILSILMASVMCLHFSMQEEDILEHINAKCHLSTLLSPCRKTTTLWEMRIRGLVFLAFIAVRRLRTRMLCLTIECWTNARNGGVRSAWNVPTYVVANSELRCIAAKFGKDVAMRDKVVQVHLHPTHKTHKKKSNVAFYAHVTGGSHPLMFCNHVR